MRRTALALLGLVTACTSGNLETGGDASSDASPSSDAALLPSNCADAGVPPSTLDCTGLYADLATKQLAPNAQAYAPATPLWSDGAQKSRWIELPPGTTIDATNPDEWTFPIGTKVFKEFRVSGKRVETRMFQKTRATYWVYTTYAWNADDSSAVQSFGETVPVGTDGGSWNIPTPDQCDECHRGRSDRILGFEQVGLGLPGATGLTLAQLVAQRLLSPPPASVSLKIGDDGTGLAAPALAWMHVNCGVTCHNANESSEGYGAGMLLRLDPAVLDGRPAVGWDPLRTTIDVAAISGSVTGVKRILPGDPTGSAIVQLISERGTIQMPPVGSKMVDTVDVAAIVSWIAHLPSDAGATEDAGSEDAASPLDAAAEDSGEDAGTMLADAAPPDATVADAGAGDATLASDTGPEDAALPDAGPADVVTDATLTADAGVADGAGDAAAGDAPSD